MTNPAAGRCSGPLRIRAALPRIRSGGASGRDYRGTGSAARSSARRSRDLGDGALPGPARRCGARSGAGAGRGRTRTTSGGASHRPAAAARFQEQLVGIAPGPLVAGFRRAHERVPGRLVVSGGVSAGRAVAASHVAAGQTQSQAALVTSAGDAVEARAAQGRRLRTRGRRVRTRTALRPATVRSYFPHRHHSASLPAVVGPHRPAPILSGVGVRADAMRSSVVAYDVLTPARGADGRRRAIRLAGIR